MSAHPAVKASFVLSRRHGKLGDQLLEPLGMKRPAPGVHKRGDTELVLGGQVRAVGVRVHMPMGFTMRV